MIIPTTFYMFNAQEFVYDYVLMVPVVVLALFLLLAGLIYCLIGSYALKKFRIYNRVIQIVFAAAGIIIYLNDLISPTQAPVLNGEIVTIPEPILLTVIELCIALSVIIYLIIKFKKNQDEKVLISTSLLSMGLFVLLLVGVLFINVSQEVNTTKSISNTQNPLTSDPKLTPNVYLLWLDAMQTDYFIKAMNEKNWTENFEGFTLFEHNMSNYLVSYQSYHSFMSGTLYAGQNYKEWMKNDIMRKKFVEHGYNLTSYAVSHYVSKLDNYNIVSEQILEEALAIEHPHISNFISLSLVRVSPNFLANESLSFSQNINNKVNALFNPTEVLNINDRDAGMHPYIAPLSYEKMIEDEYKRHESGEFVLSQVILPHGPEVMDENCVYHQPKKIKGQLEGKYFDQVHCALKLINNFMNTLKELDRYNNSMIIIMGDHGAGITGLVDKEVLKNRVKKPINAKYSGMNEVRMLQRVSALLMVKPPQYGSPERFKISNKESQLVDILPTILNALNWSNTESYDGQDLFSSDSEDRNSILTLFKPKPTPNFDDAEVYHLNYDPKMGRTEIKLIDTFNDYFELSN